MESIQAPVVENEPIIKDGGLPKSTSVKPLEAQDEEGEDEVVVQNRQKVRDNMYRDRLGRLKESQKQ